MKPMQQEIGFDFSNLFSKLRYVKNSLPPQFYTHSTLDRKSRPKSMYMMRTKYLDKSNFKDKMGQTYSQKWNPTTPKSNTVKSKFFDSNSCRTLNGQKKEIKYFAVNNNCLKKVQANRLRIQTQPENQTDSKTFMKQMTINIEEKQIKSNYRKSTLRTYKRKKLSMTQKYSDLEGAVEGHRIF